MNDAAQPDEQNDLTTREGRSPGYPYIPLKQALARAKALRKAITKNDARIATAGNVWKLGVKSSGLRQTVAALKQFGLIEYIGSAEDRKVKLTASANRIILDERPDSPERDALIQKVALLPKVHAELWEKWGKDLPPDIEIVTELTLERGFSQSGANEFVTEYKETLAFANLVDVDKMPDMQSDISDRSGSPEQGERSKVNALHALRNPASSIIEERIVYKPGQDIFLRFTSEPDVEIYDFLKDYLEFRLSRLKKSGPKE
jgi:hypothetical protein